MRLRPPKDEAEEVAVHASTEHRATAAARMRNRVEEEYILLVKSVFEILYESGLYSLQ